MVSKKEMLEKLYEKVEWVCFADETANEFEAIEINDLLDVLVECGIVKKLDVKRAGFEKWYERNR